MRDLMVELKQLRLHGMALAWSDLVEQGSHAGLDTSRWLLEHLLQAELTDRTMRSVSHQMHAAKFPVHRDLAGFDFAVSPVDRKLIQQLAELAFTEPAHNAVLVGGPGTGKTHLATAIGVSGISRHGKRVRFYSTVDLVNALEQEKVHGRAGRIATSLLRMDLIILDELGYLPFSQAGGALLFHLLSRLYEHTSVLITTNLDFAELVDRVRRREDDHRAARSLDASLPHRGNRQRQPPLSAQQRRGQVAHQVAGASQAHECDAETTTIGSGDLSAYEVLDECNSTRLGRYSTPRRFQPIDPGAFYAVDSCAFEPSRLIPAPFIRLRSNGGGIQ